MQQIHKRLAEMYGVINENPDAEWSAYLRDNGQMFQVKIFKDKQIVVKEKDGINAKFLDLYGHTEIEFISRVRDAVDELSR